MGNTTRALRRAAALVAVALMLAACTKGGAPGAAGGGQTGAESAEETANLTKAWKEDPAKVGLPALQPPADKITVVDTKKYAKDGPYKIAFASQGPTNSWAQIYDNSLRARAESAYKDQVEILYADAGGKADKQVNDIEDLVVQQPDALIVTPLGPSVKAPIERAAAQNIPVVLCTGRVDTDRYVTRVDRDNRLNGSLTAEWIAKQLDGKGDIIMLSGIAGVPTAEDRLAAAKKIFTKYPGIKVLAQEYTNWSPTDGKRVMESLLVAHPKIDAIWSDSAIQDIGVIQAFKEAGRKIPPMTTEPLNGFLKLAKDNNVQFLAVGYPPGHSARCLDAAVDALKGKPLPNFINVDAPLFTDKEIDQYLKADCSNDLWVPTELPQSKLSELKLC
jgi:ribose transport system substrate-binding protein